jgi:acetoin utilization deacetylase AcuC-like enzyme
MKVVYTEGHRRHNPPHAFAGGCQTAFDDPPERAERILSAVCEAGLDVVEPGSHGLDAVRTVHSDDYLEYLASAYEAWVAGDKSPDGVIPSTFPTRPMSRKPGLLFKQAGWYCFDTETPIAENTLDAALGSASCALTGADLLLEGERCAYALTRPPGHHAGRDFCGGYCYLNNAALAARRLLDVSGARASVAIVDVDCHHGNGTQGIFYEMAEVFYASVHADPNSAYPYYWGYAEETGAGAGAGLNLNVPLPTGTGESAYLDALASALEVVARFRPAYLVVSLGTDAVAEDPLGLLALSADTFAKVGQRIAELDLPALVVQEGGYDLASIGECVASFLLGLSRQL